MKANPFGSLPYINKSLKSSLKKCQLFLGKKQCHFRKNGPTGLPNSNSSGRHLPEGLKTKSSERSRCVFIELSSYRFKWASKMQGIWWYLLWFWQIALLLGDFLKRRKFNLMFWGKGNSYIDPTICRKVTLPKTNSECHWKMGAWGTIRLSFWAKGLFSGFMWDLPHTQYQWKVKVWFGIRHLKCFRILLVTAWYEILLARISYHENLIRVPPQRHRDKALLRSINHHHPLTRLYFLERGGIGNSHEFPWS